MAGAVWPKARRDGGSTMLVEEEEGLAWWWRVARTVAERDTVQSEQRLAIVAWPEARRDGGSTMLVEKEWGLEWWCRQNSCRERDGEDAVRARKKKRGSLFCALIKLYGLGSINNQGI
ncbi:hypothetical protein DEO72_LG6g1294 [Vigna unguiculata]|uniref:Uncharacterized protein n=1 Tax=Vigna unguiculata TaxID=3917 RepID=A0A4D6M7U5_VIGUN|nr:hypothetical protein DEO72_LG6g1294 [Vigna unguiculata]